MVKSNDITKHTSDILKEYYSDLSNLNLLNKKLEVLNKTKDKIEYDINNSNITLSPYLTSVDYSNVKVSTSISQSTQEKAIDKAYLQLENQLQDTLISIIETKTLIRDLEYKTYDIKYTLSTLSEEKQNLISLKYRDKHTNTKISLEFNMCPSNVSRRISKALNEIYGKLNIQAKSVINHL